MLCADLWLAADKEFPAEFFNEFYNLDESERADIRKLMDGVPCCEKNLSRLLEIGIIKSISINSPAFPILKQLAKLSTSVLKHKNKTNTILAHPAIDAEAVTALRVVAIATATARRVLAVNPNAPEEVQIKATQSSPMFDQALALAKYGNQKIHSVYRAMKQLIELGGFSDIETRQIHRALAGRPDLHETLIRSLDIRICQADRAPLEKCANYRKAVLRPDVKNFERAFGENSLKLGEDVDEQTIGKIYDAINSNQAKQLGVASEVAMAAIAIHPNCPKRVLDSILADGQVKKHIGLKGHITESTNAEKIITEVVTSGTSSPASARFLARIKTCSEPGLKLVMDYVTKKDRKVIVMTGNGSALGLDPERHTDAAAIMSHPNFPWKAYSPEEIADISHPPHMTSIAVSLHLTGGQMAKEILPLLHLANPIAAVFSPGVSAHRLERIATENPDIAPLCAMHPNGDSIQIQDSTQKATVEEFKRRLPSVSLSGKSAQAASAEHPTIQL